MTEHSKEEDDGELTTSGRTYQELVEQFGRDSEMTEESELEEADEYNRRKSVGCFLSGRNSISNWTTFGNQEEDTMESVPVRNVNGKEVRVSSLETPTISRDFSGVNVSTRNSRVNSRQKSSKDFRKSNQSNNLSHISSSSSSMGEDVLGESWSPIRSNMGNSLDEKKSPKRSLSKSPVRTGKSLGRSKSPVRSAKSRSKSPIKRGKSPTRSPLADVSPNRSRGQSPKRSLLKSPQKSALKEALSPNGTYSLKEAEGMQTEEVTKPKSLVKSKLTLPSLGRKSVSSQLFSPEKPVTGTHARSPVPTPNSQRRVIKRLRASLPTANCMDQDEVMEEQQNAEMQVTQSISKRAESTSMASVVKKAQVLPPMTYKNDFVFPDISGPLGETIALFHKDAISMGPNSHQHQLTVAGTGLVSLQEVILPAVAYDTNNVLKKLQAKAQRNVKDGMPDHQGRDVVDVIENCRKIVHKCTAHAITEAGKAWREKQERRQQDHLELHAAEMEKQKQLRAQAKLQRKQERALHKQQAYERQRYEKQKSHPRNKEMWQEVAKLMMEIQKLEKEERLWKEALAEVKAMEKNFQPPEKIDLVSLDDSNSPRAEQQEALVKSVEGADLEAKSTTMVQDVTMATERISWMLQSVSLAMEESDRLRQEAYSKYQYDGHKFYGYQTGDSKGLFHALSMDDSFAC